MTSWNDAHAAAPDLAERVRGRFEEHGLALMATLRRDGSPRISGIEPLFAGEELWLGMMVGSRKAADLERDPRLALHSATVDRNVTAGDARVHGRGVRVRDEETHRWYVERLREVTGGWAPEGWFPVFRVDVEELTLVRPVDGRLVVEWWRRGGPVRRVERE